MAFIRWNENTHIWELAVDALNKSTLFNHLPIANPTLPLDTVNKQYVDGLGVPVDIPFNPANFTSDTGAWTVVSQTTFTYSLIGKTVNLSIEIIGNDSTLTGTPTFLRITLPSIGLPTRSVANTMGYFVAGGLSPGTGIIRIHSGAPQLDIIRDVLGTAWAPGTPYIYANIAYFI